MVNKLYYILIILLVPFINVNKIYALEELPLLSEEACVIKINGNKFKGRETGQMSIAISNVAEELDRDINVTMTNTTTYETFILTLFKIYNYKDAVKIPVGNYKIDLASVNNDGASRYPIESGKEFNIKAGGNTFVGLKMKNTSSLPASDREGEQEQIKQEYEEKQEEKIEEIKQEEIKKEKDNTIMKTILSIVAFIILYIIVYVVHHAYINSQDNE